MAIELTTATESQLLGIRQSLGLSGCISVKDYGAVGDGRKIQATSVTNSVYTAPSGSFSQSDVGKVAWAVLAGGMAIQQLGVVSSVTGSTQATLSGTYTGPGTWSNPIVYIGTNDTTAIQNAWTAAKTAGVPMFIPAGCYFVNRQVAGVNSETSGNYGVIGEGSKHSRIVLMPDFASTGAVSTGLIINMTGCGYNTCKGIGIDGAYKDLSLSGNYGISLDSQASTWRVRGSSEWVDIAIENLKGFTSAFYFGLSINSIVDGIFSYNHGYIGITMNGFIGNASNVWVSNGSGFGMQIVGGSSVTFNGTLIDEQSYYTLQVTNATVKFRDSILYGGSGMYCLELVSPSTVTFDGCEVEPYLLHANSSAILCPSGCTVKARNSEITGTGTGKCITGAGTLIDEGGNTFTGTVDVTTRKGTTFGTPLIHATKTPASASAAGNAGEIAWDSSYIYVCTATNQWKRVAIATW